MVVEYGPHMSMFRRSPGAFPARPSLLFGTSAHVPLAGMHVVQGSILSARVILRCRADSLKIGSDKWPARSWNMLISTRLRSLPTWKRFYRGPNWPVHTHHSISLASYGRNCPILRHTPQSSRQKCSGVNKSMPYLNHTEWGGIRPSQAQAPTPWGKPS